MSEDKNMNEKYQQYYNQLLTGTLTETLLKGVSFQANIKLANDIIAEQDKTILELQSNVENFKKELDTLRNNKVNTDNSKIVSLENTIKSHLATISKLQADLYEMNKNKSEYENVKHQVQHIDTYRNEVVKANDTIKTLQEQHKSVVNSFEEKIKSLMVEIAELKTPAPATKKKASKVVVKEEPVTTKSKAKIIKQELPGLIVKDGGSF